MHIMNYRIFRSCDAPSSNATVANVKILLRLLHRLKAEYSTKGKSLGFASCFCVFVQEKCWFISAPQNTVSMVEKFVNAVHICEGV